MPGWWFGTFFHILGIIILTDFHIFLRGWNHQPGAVFVEFHTVLCFGGCVMVSDQRAGFNPVGELLYNSATIRWLKIDQVVETIMFHQVVWLKMDPKYGWKIMLSADQLTMTELEVGCPCGPRRDARDFFLMFSNYRWPGSSGGSEEWAKQRGINWSANMQIIAHPNMLWVNATHCMVFPHLPGEGC